LVSTAAGLLIVGVVEEAMDLCGERQPTGPRLEVSSNAGVAWQAGRGGSQRSRGVRQLLRLALAQPAALRSVWIGIRAAYGWRLRGHRPCIS
jgi:hypothetical protein